MWAWVLAAGLFAGWAALAVLLFQVVRQQGRILLRLDGIEQRLADRGSGDTLTVVRSAGDAAGGAAPEPLGLAPQTVVPPFALRDLDGRTVALADLRGRGVLLTHWSPDCGFCDLVAPDLSARQHRLREHGVDLVLVSWGDAGTNRAFAAEHGLDCPILLVDGDAPEAFAGIGTPAAYLLDADGRVTRPLALGADEIVALADDAARGRRRLRTERPLTESRIERDGLRAGTPAPAFTLPEVRDGAPVSLEDYRGRRVLLVFSDPDCGPCQELAPALARVYRERGDSGLELIMVGRGDRDDNREKADEHDLDFPVVLQDRWKLSKAYGIFATPVGFLIGEDGVIERDVATGGDEILALAHQALRKERTDGRIGLR